MRKHFFTTICSQSFLDIIKSKIHLSRQNLGTCSQVISSSFFNWYLQKQPKSSKNTKKKIHYDYHLELLCTIRSWELMKIDWLCLIKVYWILTSQPSSNDQSALMHPYCVYNCELIYIAAKHPQDIERAPLEPNTNYICLFLGKWPLSMLDQCGHQRSEQYISVEKLVCHRAAHLPTNLLLTGSEGQ